MFRMIGKTHPGSVREHNEDAFYCDEDAGLAAVVDGMGGYAAGEVASDIIVKSLEQIQPETNALVAALVECHNRILAHSQEHPESQGMGAAAVIAKLESEHLSVCWAGDSRAYLFNRETGLRPVSRDHSYVQWLLSQGHISESEAREHPKRNLVTQCLGLNSPQPEVNRVAWIRGEVLLLCSDGLTDELDDQRITDILQDACARDDALTEAADELVAAALDSGGKDNVTVVLAENRSEARKEPSPAREAPPAARAGRIPWVPILLGVSAAVVVLVIGVIWQLYSQ